LSSDKTWTNWAREMPLSRTYPTLETVHPDVVFVVHLNIVDLSTIFGGSAAAHRKPGILRQTKEHAQPLTSRKSINDAGLLFPEYLKQMSLFSIPNKSSSAVVNIMASVMRKVLFQQCCEHYIHCYSLYNNWVTWLNRSDLQFLDQTPVWDLICTNFSSDGKRSVWSSRSAQNAVWSSRSDHISGLGIKLSLNNSV